jgi:hypothetical protein
VTQWRERDVFPGDDPAAGSIREMSGKLMPGIKLIRKANDLFQIQYSGCQYKGRDHDWQGKDTN